MIVNDRLHGFTVTRIRESAELGGKMVEMTHDKTGAELVWVDNGLNNKVFSIAFKTLPENSTGVFHILEHSMLCGSEKFPVREPFVELMKSSMATELNAYTFPDKTMYPVASRNTKDFLNLTEVYLDAVFAPKLLTDANIFRQEGWHIEQEGDKLKYKGVVFNEMKGALSVPMQMLGEQFMIAMFPDNCYGFNSGGDPDVIPELTYEKFVETYRRFYHPSNSRIYLDGDVPMEETLSLIDGYLSRFEKSDDLPEIPVQKPITKQRSVTYELAENEDPENKEYLFTGKILCTWKDRVELTLAEIIMKALTDNNDAPLKRAVLSAGLAEDLLFDYVDMLQPFVYLIGKNVADGKSEEFIRLIRSTAKELADKGVDRAALEAEANRLEFKMREKDEPQGIDRAIECLRSWLYGGDPMQYLTVDDCMVEVRRMIRSGEADALLRKMFVEEEGTVTLRGIPSHTRGEELRRIEDAKLRAIRATWTSEYLADNADMNEKLVAWQQTEDTPEQLATLPTLSIDEIDGTVEHIETAEDCVDGVTVLRHKVNCGGIVHLTTYFSLADKTLDELSTLAVLVQLFGKLPTQHYSLLELGQALKNCTGRMDFSIVCNAREGQVDTCTPYLCVTCSALADKVPEAEALLAEILLHTRLDQAEKLRELMVQINNRAKQRPIGAGHQIAIRSVFATLSSTGAVSEALSGYTYIRTARKLAEDFDGKMGDIIRDMDKLRRETFCRARMMRSVNGDADVSKLIGLLPVGKKVPAETTYVSELPCKMGLSIPAAIGFSGQGAHLARMGIPYDGSMSVAANVISLGYLWNKVRVQGGAYGTGLRIERNGSVFTYSYRDPSPAASLQINGGASEYLRQFCASDESTDKYIISTLGEKDPLQTPLAKCQTGDYNWFSGVTKEVRYAERRQVLTTDKAKLLATCEVWDRMAAEGPKCVVGFADMLDKCEDLTRCEL